MKRRETWVVIAAVLVVSVVVCGLVGFELWRTRDGALSVARTRSSNLARVLEEQTRGAVTAVDLSLLDLVEELRLKPETASHDPAFTKRLRSRVADLPYVRALFVVGPDGFIIQDSDLDTPRRSVADRDYFRAHQQAGDTGLFMGQPLKSRSDGAPWFLSMSRRITLEDGSFYGVAVAALEPRYVARFYATLDIGEGGSVALVHRDGLMVARHPDHEGVVGSSIKELPLLRDYLPQGPTGTFAITSPVDGIERVYSYRTVDPLPIVVMVGITKAAALQNWRANARVAGIATVGLIVFLVLAAAAYLRQRERDVVAAERLSHIEKSEALGRITSSLAHDFNNLLTVICGNLEVLEDKLPEGNPLRRKVANATAAAAAGTRLVGQLLAFARRQPVASSEENPTDVLLGFEDLLRHAASPADLVVRCAPDTWPCIVDRGEFERAVMNLVVNARDAEPKDSIKIETRNIPKSELDEVAWAELKPGDYIACEVTDDGQGMSAEVLRRASEPFFTTKSEGHGTGLGLSQVYGFARQSGGGMRIQSAVGAGTTITVLLPRSPRSSMPIAQEERRAAAV